ncbi:MAG TPA: hypothetical protein VN258_01930 [Mobilitalea sp.]|nr:hypothetical protein [Mobilitalea sp.]
MTARFITEDTYTGQQNDPLSLNLYTYCVNNPIKYDDPSGHMVNSYMVAENDGGGRHNKDKGGNTNKDNKSTNGQNSKNNVTHNSYYEDKNKDNKGNKDNKDNNNKATPTPAPNSKKDTNNVEDKNKKNQKETPADAAKKTARSTAEGVADTVVGDAISKLPERTKGITEVPELGVAAKVESSSINAGTKAFKTVSKVATPVA